MDVLITVFQAEIGKYQCYCVKRFCCLLWGNVYHSNHSYSRGTQTERWPRWPWIWRPYHIKVAWLISSSKAALRIDWIIDHKYITALLGKENSI